MSAILVYGGIHGGKSLSQKAMIEAALKENPNLNIVRVTKKDIPDRPMTYNPPYSDWIYRRFMDRP
jgi:hypothetical protein